MLQFKHYHDAKSGYTDVYSKSCTPEDINIFGTLSGFEAKDTCFTYLPLNSKAYFLQATKDGIYEFSHGLAGNMAELKEDRAAEYINQLEREHRTVALTDGFISEGRLPLRCREFGISLARGLKPVFAEIIDALVYGTKPVIIVGKDALSLVNYVKVVFSLLPRQYANNIGFSVCPKELPSFYFDGDLPNKIRLIATEQDVSENSSRVVINVDRYEKTNKELGAYAKVIDSAENMLSSGAGQRLEGFVRSVCPSFRPDGTIDKDQLEIAIAVYNFDIDRSSENARRILSLLDSDKTSVITKFTVVDAIDELIKDKSLSKEDEALIVNARKDSEINDLVKEPLGRFAFDKLSSGAVVSQAQMSDIVDFMKSLSENDLIEDGEIIAPLFKAKRSADTVSLFASLYHDTHKPEFLKLIASYADILKTYNSSQQSGEDFDAGILKAVSAFKEDEGYLIASVMISCYSFDVTRLKGAKAKTKHRMDALKSFIDSKVSDPKEKIEYILSLKSSVEAIADMLGKDVRGADDFEFLPSEYVKSLITSAGFSRLLSIANEGSVDFSTYSELQIAILEKLSDIREVKKNLSADGIEFYEQFLDDYERELDSRNAGESLEVIRKYISEIKGSADIKNRLLEFRCNFIIGEYDGLPNNEKIKIKNKLNNELKGEEQQSETQIKASVRKKDGRDAIRDLLNSNDSSKAVMKKKQIVAEDIKKIITNLGRGGSGKANTLNSTYFIYAFVFSALFVLLSAALFISIPVVCASLLGTPVMERVVGFFESYHIMAMIYVGILNFVGYFIRWKNSNHERKDSLKKAVKTTVLYGILPVFLYAAAYLLTYIVL